MQYMTIHKNNFYFNCVYQNWLQTTVHTSSMKSIANFCCIYHMELPNNGSIMVFWVFTNLGINNGNVLKRLKCKL